MPRWDVIENVALEYIRPGDGAQKFRYTVKAGMPDHLKWGVMWLTGWNRAERAEVGMRGKLVWRTGPTYGLYFFVRDGE